MKRKTATEMFPWMEKYEARQLSRSELCTKSGITNCTFQYWWKRYREQKDEKEGSFISVDIMEEEHESDKWKMEIELNPGVRLRFRDLIPLPYLSQVLSLP